MSTTALEVDILVVGAGIAGLAIAEQLLYEGSVRGRTPSVLLIDSSDSIGAGSSSGLQGWFHTGALYATLVNRESIQQCARAEHLIDDLRKRLRAERSIRNWLGDPLTYLVDPELADSIGSRIASLSEPHTLDHHSQSSFCFPEDIQNRFVPILTRDRQICTRAVMNDLAMSICARGGQFMMKHQIKEWEPSGEALVVPAGTPHTGPDCGIRVRPKRLILTAGHQIANLVDTSRTDLSRRRGIILSVTPSINAPNFVRVATDHSENLSCIQHRSQGYSYSAFGDSTYVDPNANHDQCQRVAEHILSKVIALFGTRSLSNRRIAWHACNRIESLHADSTEPCFRPVVWNPAANDRVIVALPSKFSLFPLLSKAVARLAESASWFDDFTANSIPLISTAPIPPIAPTRAEISLDLRPSRTPQSLLGQLSVGSDTHTPIPIVPPMINPTRAHRFLRRTSSGHAIVWIHPSHPWE